MAESEALMNKLITHEDESSMEISSGLEDPDLMGWGEPRFTEEREGAPVHTLVNGHAQTDVHQGSSGPSQRCKVEVQGSERSACSSKCRS